MASQKEIWKVVKPRRGTRHQRTYAVRPPLTDEDMRIFTERAKQVNASTKLVITEQDTRSGSFGPHKRISGQKGTRRRSRIRRRRSSRKKSPVGSRVRPRRRSRGRKSREPGGGGRRRSKKAEPNFPPPKRSRSRVRRSRQRRGRRRSGRRRSRSRRKNPGLSES